MNFVQPNMKHGYADTGRETINAELMVPTLPNKFFRVRMSPCQMILRVQIKVPDIFVDKQQQLCALGGAGFNRNTHQNTAYNNCIDAIEEQCDDGAATEDGSLNIWGDPMEFKLEFKCEEDVNWEVQFFPNDEEGLTDTLGGQQFFAILNIKLTSVEKPKARNAGRVRVITLPQAMDEDGTDGNDDDDDL